MRIKRIISITIGIFLFLHVVLLLTSWIISAAWPEFNVQSLLSSAGIRWIFGNFTTNLMQPVFIWLILASISLSTIKQSQLLKAIAHPRKLNYRCRTALGIALGVMAIILMSLIILAFMPHAILLSATGYIYPSAFMYNIVPTSALVLALTASTYGWVSGVFRSLQDIIDSMALGIIGLAQFVVLYIIATQFICTFAYVFGIMGKS